MRYATGILPLIPLLITLLIPLALCRPVPAHAKMPEETKIERLIAAVRTTPEGTRFIRNGSEYGSGQAAEHLRSKYARGKKYAATAREFIDNIASQSSFSGRDYIIKFPDGTTVTAREFFSGVLERIEKGDATAP